MINKIELTHPTIVTAVVEGVAPKGQPLRRHVHGIVLDLAAVGRSGQTSRNKKPGQFLDQKIPASGHWQFSQKSGLNFVYSVSR